MSARRAGLVTLLAANECVDHRPMRSQPVVSVVNDRRESFFVLRGRVTEGEMSALSIEVDKWTVSKR